MPLKSIDSTIKTEDHIQLAIKGFEDGRSKSIRAAAAAFDVPYRTPAHRINGRKARSDVLANR